MSLHKLTNFQYAPWPDEEDEEIDPPDFYELPHV